MVVRIVRRAVHPLVVGTLLLCMVAVCTHAPAVRGSPPPATTKERSVEEYRYLRALSIDLEGRVPSRAELAAFERPDFDLDAFIERKLHGQGYVDRLTRIYMDALRLEVSPLTLFTPSASTLFAQTIRDDRGALVRVFYRHGQRRTREATDGDFCLTSAESGIDPTKPVASDALPRVSRDVLDKATVLVRPWWLYRDYRKANPQERIDQAWTPSRYFQPAKDLVLQPDGKTPIVDLRVCREEAQTAARGTLWVSDRDATHVPVVPRRRSALPFEDPYARKHKGEAIECATTLGVSASIDCGCGPGLERCMPQVADYSLTFSLPSREPIGLEGAFGFGANHLTHYERWWWRAEVIAILGHVFGEDRDVRELVTGRYSYVNGPLAQFYRYIEPASCCGNERPLGMMTETDPLFDPSRLPSVAVNDADTWSLVEDRGPHAAGLLTTAAYLHKYASRRARAAAAYTGLLCKNFIADSAAAPPSRDPNLMVRPGCANCHAVLEPLAAYFSHVKEGATTFLSLPTENPQCRVSDGRLIGFCPDYFDPDFSTATSGLMRGAYASREHADAGPAGLGAMLAASPDYQRCAVDRVASSFLGRPLNPDDDALRDRLLTKFAEGGNRMRALVRAVVLDPSYASSRLGPSATTTPGSGAFVHPPIPASWVVDAGGR
jgi:hypothetical protein